MNTFCRHGLSNSVLSLVNDDTHQEGQEEKWNNELGKQRKASHRRKK